jgi:hypothetical protein
LSFLSLTHTTVSVPILSAEIKKVWGGALSRNGKRQIKRRRKRKRRRHYKCLNHNNENKQGNR